MAARGTTTATFVLDERGRPIHSADDLLRGQDEACIVLGENVYTLRLTRAGKLILTK